MAHYEYENLSQWSPHVSHGISFSNEPQFMYYLFYYFTVYPFFYIFYSLMPDFMSWWEYSLGHFVQFLYSPFEADEQETITITESHNLLKRKKKLKLYCVISLVQFEKVKLTRFD